MSAREPTLADVLIALDRLRGDLMARLDRQQDAITAIRDDIAVNFGRADRAIDYAKSLRTEFDDLTREVAAMERQIQRLQTEVRQLQGPL